MQESALYERFVQDLQAVACLPEKNRLEDIMHSVPFQDLHVALQMALESGFEDPAAQQRAKPLPR